MKKPVVLAAAIILLALAVTSCGGPPAVAKVAVPMTPILVTEDTPIPTSTPTDVPSPMSTPLPVACQPVELTKVTDDPVKFRKIGELMGLDNAKAIEMGQHMFAVYLSGSVVEIFEISTPPTPIVLVSRDSSQSSVAFVEKWVYSVKLSCIQEGSRMKTEEVRFYFAGDIPYIFFPK